MSETTHRETLEKMLAAAVAAESQVVAITAALAALDREGQAWQPIETAPKDGKEFLAYPCDVSDMGVIRWDCDPEDESGQCWRGQDNERIENDPPTHWMPLPAAPLRQARDAEEETK